MLSQEEKFLLEKICRLNFEDISNRRIFLRSFWRNIDNISLSLLILLRDIMSRLPIRFMRIYICQFKRSIGISNDEDFIPLSRDGIIRS